MVDLSATALTGNPVHRKGGGKGVHTLAVEDLHAHYGRVCALHGISFEIHCGQALALIGGNGAGKTTLMKAIVKLIPATTGRVIWSGTEVSSGTHEMAYLPQRSEHDRRFPITVRGLVELGRYPLLGNLRPFGPRDVEAVDEALAVMQIEDLAARQIGELSGGQQQRAFIARALAQEAHVVLLDEPFAGLDQPAVETLTGLLRQLTQNGCLVIASHHDLNNVADIFDVALLLHRRMVALGPPHEVLTPEHIREAMGG